MSVDIGARKLLRLEVRNAETPIERKPPWIKTKLRTGPEFTACPARQGRGPAHGVPGSGLPNIYECWEDREATFLIGGDQCTRRCDFCQIETGKPDELDRDEPRRVAESVRTMGLRYATVTGVAATTCPTAVPGCTPRPSGRSTTCALDRGGDARAGLQRRAGAARSDLRHPTEVFAHNVETVPRIFRRIRPGFRYERSLDVLPRRERPAW